MRKRSWLIAVGCLAGLFLVLLLVSHWLIRKGGSLTFHMGAKIDRPEYVGVNYPFTVDVIYHATDRMKQVEPISGRSKASSFFRTIIAKKSACTSRC
jgi:hypothetical protein